jgi:hypothetical protein
MDYLKKTTQNSINYYTEKYQKEKNYLTTKIIHENNDNLNNSIIVFGVLIVLSVSSIIFSLNKRIK